jgi:hypothetical protein
MKLFYIVSIFFAGLFYNLQAQDTLNFGIGINVSNNLINLGLGNYKYGGGFCVEPVILFKVNDYLDLKTIVGYSKTSNQYYLINNSPSEQTLDYLNEGLYIKVGLFTGFKPKSELFHHSFGVSLFYTQFNETGDLTIKGNYFGDYKNEFKNTGQKILFFEPSVDLVIYQNKYFSFSTNINIPIKIYTSIQQNLYNYYIPGYGAKMTDHKFNLQNLFYRVQFYIVVPIEN